MNEEIPSWLVREMLAERSLSRSLCLVASLLVVKQRLRSCRRIQVSWFERCWLRASWFRLRGSVKEFQAALVDTLL